MLCDGCLCMTCIVLESCPYYLRCDSIPEMTECRQRKSCGYYCPEKNSRSKNNKQNNNKKGTNANEQMV